MSVHLGSYINTWQRYYNLMKARYERQKRLPEDLTRTIYVLNQWYNRSMQLTSMREQMVDRTVNQGEIGLRLVK